MSLTLLVPAFAFAHVPNKAGFGAGGVVPARAGIADDSSEAATAVVVMSAAKAARGTSFHVAPLRSAALNDRWYPVQRRCPPAKYRE